MTSPRSTLVWLTLLLSAPAMALAEGVSRVLPAEAGMRADHLQNIEREVLAALEEGQFAGCVVAVGRQGKLVLLDAYGDRQVEPTHLPMQTDTVFDMASLTKPVATATSVMRLLEQGKLRLHDRAKDHLPDLTGKGTDAITIEHLLTHQAGYVPDNSIRDYEDGIEKAWERLLALPVKTPPGTQFKYSDVGFEMLGLIVERIDGRPLNRFAKEEIFTPLGMKDTGYLPGESQRARAAATEQRESRWMVGEVHDPRAWRLGGVAGHAGLFSTAEDLAIFASALLDGGDWQGTRILGRQTVKEMTRARDASGHFRTAGWDARSAYSSNRSELFSPRAFGHGGFTGTAMWIDPDLDLFVIFLSNRLHPDGEGSINHLAGRIGTIAAAAIEHPVADDPAPVAKPTVAEYSAVGTHFAVATVQPLATDAAMDVFREGGNAVDAAIAAALTLGVVDNHNSGIGGGCLILVRKPDGELLAIDGREMAPAAAHRDMYLVDGVGDPSLSQVGPLAVGTPGALAAYAQLLEQAGSKPFSRLLAPGLKAAREGFMIDSNYARRLEHHAPTLAQFPGSKAQLLKKDGSPYLEGERLVQPDLAATYEALSQHGPDWFYRGPFAQRVGNWMKGHGGVLRANDFADYEAKIRTPVISTYRGRTIIGFPPPSSGGVHVAQILNLLEPFDLKKAFKTDEIRAGHLIIEAMKLAFADRAHWLGDADFVEVPRGLASKKYADTLSTKIDPDRSTPVESHGTPPRWRQDLFGRHTTHIVTADAEGYWVSITATVNTGFGSKVIVPGTGVVLNNEMDDFSIQPGVPNVFGLLGGENNAVEPGKRPLSSMSPTIVLDEEGEPVLAVGAAGGPRIISQVVLAIVRWIDQGLTPAEAVAAPRLHHQWRPDEVIHEETLPSSLLEGLVERGHRLSERPSDSSGVTQAIARDGQGRLVSIHDPRIPGKACAE